MNHRRPVPGRRQLSRRTFLRGAGTALALPWLEAMTPLGRTVRAAASPKRLFVFYVPNGIRMDAWTPTATGANFDLPPILTPLASLKNEILVVSGLANHPAEDTVNGDHARGTASFLTCARPRHTEGADIANGISMDQVLANALAGATIYPSLQLGGEGGAGIGDCDSGYSCAYLRNISWAGPATPLGKETYPESVFNRLFQTQAANAAERARGLARRTGVLDFVRDDASRLARTLGQRDRAKLDEYLTGVDELDGRIQKLAAAPGCAATPFTPPTDQTARVRAFIDIAVLAFQCDLTRVVTFMLGNAASNITYPALGVTDGHHQISHHQGNADNLAKLQAIDTWEVQQFAYLVERLRSTTEGADTLLDASVALFASEIEDGDFHRHTNLPVLLAGRAGGAITPGRHLRYPNGDPLANLYIALLNALGAPVTTFGMDGTGPLAGLGA